MKHKTVLIVDDEPFARDDLRHLLLCHPNFEVVGEAGSIKEAEQFLSRTTPDIIFLDIQLRGGSGFDLVPHISSASNIIFFTAYDGYEDKISHTNAIDYLLKPVSAERLGDSLKKLKR
jgi:DNA-binding LytR/AlgR family response regulator